MATGSCAARRGRRLDVWIREGKGSQRTPRPLPQELAWNSAIPGDRQTQGEEEESGRKAQREDYGKDTDRLTLSLHDTQVRMKKWGS